jgi:16S rRNA (cytidine1402-2'-O)-methyltransferase
VTLYVVSTPIGNLGDITQRAVEVLASVEQVLAEDTRHSKRLFDALGLRVSLQAYHDHSSDAARLRIVERLVAGADLALISDAGTPCVSDPGYALVRDARAAGVTIVAVPGASALLAFLAAAGLPTDRFQFVGFAPRKAGERADAVAEWCAYPGTTVVYESPQRVSALVAAIAAYDPGRPLVIGRELTKRHEEFIEGSAADVVTALAAHSHLKGEVVVGIRGAERRVAVDESTVADWVAALASTSLRTKEAAALLARQLGVRQQDAYAQLLAARGDEADR